MHKFMKDDDDSSATRAVEHEARETHYADFPCAKEEPGARYEQKGTLMARTSLARFPRL